MKLIKFTLLFFCVAGLFACRKNTSDPDIKQFDENEIKAYIASHGLGSSMKRDAGDTTGIYYQILTQGTGPAVDYPDQVSVVFTLSTFDGKFSNTDTVINHLYTYAGRIPITPLTSLGFPLPKGVMLAIVNMLKTQGTRAHVLIPSHLGYGIYGTGQGSSSSNGRIAGNQCLDLYLNVVAVDGQGKSGVNAQAKYDSVAVKNYIAANSLTGFTALVVPSNGRNYTMYYKVTQASSSGSAIGPQSIVELQYTSKLFNGYITSDTYNSTDGTGVSIDLDSETRAGIKAGLQKSKVGDKLSLIMPSELCYGKTSGNDIPLNSCIRYDFNVISIQ